MKRALLQTSAVLSALVLVASAAAGNQESSANGRLEFVARVTPASGRTEPARGLTIFLLAKSFHDIGREAEEKTPRPDLDAFVDRLTCSRELKEWMKKQHSISLVGPEFHSHLSPDDLFRIPEFLDAYVNGNSSALNQGFPAPKYNSEDRTLNPQKYEANRKAYEVQLRKYLAGHADSLEGMDIILEQKDPSHAWGIEEMHWRERAHARALQMAQTDYLAAKTVTTLDGRGAFQAAPGAYWLSSLDGEALGGEQRLRWDVAVVVRAGAVISIELSNLNAEKKP
jgi:hypothetical protein